MAFPLPSAFWHVQKLSRSYFQTLASWDAGEPSPFQKEVVAIDAVAWLLFPI